MAMAEVSGSRGLGKLAFGLGAMGLMGWSAFVARRSDPSNAVQFHLQAIAYFMCGCMVALLTRWGVLCLVFERCRPEWVVFTMGG